MTAVPAAARPAKQATLLERDRELDAIDRALAEAIDGRGAVVAVEGPAGIGKTALLRAAAAAAYGKGLCVLTARGAALERDLPFGIVRRLFEPLGLEGRGGAAPELLAGAAALAGRAFGMGAPSDGIARLDDQFATLHGLYWLTGNLAGRAPLLLVVDDCHWADGPSLRFLAYLGGRLDGLPALVLLAARTGEPAADPELLAEVVALAGEPTIRPGALGTEAATRLVRAEVGPSATDAFCRACHTASGGNPLLLRTLAASVAAEGLPADDATAGRVPGLAAGSVARLLDRQLSRLPADARPVTAALAILGPGASERHVAELAGLDVERTAAAIDALRASAILAPVGVELDFAHPILRAAVRDDMGRAGRAAAHDRAARQLAADGAPPDRLAVHLMHTHPQGNAAVVATLRAAAGLAAERGAPETAADYLRRALDEAGPREMRGPLLLERGLALMAARRDPSAPELLQEAIGLIEPAAQRRAAALLAGRALGVAGYFNEAATLLEALPDPDEPLVAELVANSWQIAALVPGACELLAGYGPATANPFLLVNLAHRSLFLAEPAAVTAELLDRALADGRLLAEESLVTTYAAMDLVLVDRLDDAEALCSAMIDEGRRRGAASLVATFAFPRALASLRRGLLREAEADARSSYEQKLDMHGDCGPPWPLAFLVETLVERGDLAAADEALARMGPVARRPPAMLAWAFVLEARGRLRVAQGRLRDGLDDLLDAGRRWSDLRCQSPSGARWREDAALVLARLGDRSEARRLAGEHLRLAEATGLPRVLATAIRTMGAVGPREDQLARLEDAVRLLESTPARLELSRSLVELGASLRRGGRRVAARETLRRGLELAHRAGAAPLAQRARDELIAAGGRPRRPVFTGVDALTAAEHRVARLAGQGLNNREIAESLFVTQKTVETHLQHVFRKLDIHRRDDLPALEDSVDPTGQP